MKSCEFQPFSSGSPRNVKLSETQKGTAFVPPRKTMASPSGIGPSAACALVVDICRDFITKVWDERKGMKEEVSNLAEMLTGAERSGAWMRIAALVDILLGST